MADEKNNDYDFQDPKKIRGNKSYASRVSLPRVEAHLQLNLDLQLPLLDVVEPAVPIPVNEVNSDLQLLPLLDSFGEAEHHFVLHEPINEAYPSLNLNLHLGLPLLDAFPEPIDEANLSFNLNLELGLPLQLAIPAINNVPLPLNLDFPPEEEHEFTEPVNEAHHQLNLDLQLGPPPNFDVEPELVVPAVIHGLGQPNPLNLDLNLVPDPEPELVVPAVNHELGQPNPVNLDLILEPDHEPEFVVPAVNHGLGQPNPLNLDLNLVPDPEPENDNHELQFGLPYYPNLDLYVAVEPKFAGKGDQI